MVYYLGHTNADPACSVPLTMLKLFGDIPAYILAAKGDFNCTLKCSLAWSDTRESVFQSLLQPQTSLSMCSATLPFDAS